MSGSPSRCRTSIQSHLSVVRGVLETTQREMTLALEKTARSSVFNLAHDYSNALFNHVPEMIMQGQDIPIHLGSLIPAMKSVAGIFRRRYPPRRRHDAQRSQPITARTSSTPACISRCSMRASWCSGPSARVTLTDIGGPVPAGYNPDATEIYGEGLRHPADQRSTTRAFKPLRRLSTSCSPTCARDVTRKATSTPNSARSRSANAICWRMLRQIRARRGTCKPASMPN